ncbi:hypothetical protein Tco_0716622 [Tanacetum coccineum]
MWDHNNTPPFEEPTSSLVTAMLVTVDTPLWVQATTPLATTPSSLVTAMLVTAGTLFESKPPLHRPPLHRPPLRVLKPRKMRSHI